MKSLIRSLVCLLFLSPTISFAQSDASLELSPQYPAPYDKVTVTLVSYTFDVNTVKTTWSANGKILLSGIGKKSITLPLGDIGYEIPLKVESVLPDGSSVVQQVTISPQSVGLMYEAKESYVPPFYEGRSLPAEGAVVTVTALPTMSDSRDKIPEQNLSYSWYVNDEYIPKASGLGRSSIKTSLNYLREETDVRVLVRSPKGNSAEKTISISPHQIIPAVYKYDELLGVDFSTLLTNRLELTKNITLAMEPFYLSTRGLESTATYSWFVDGLPVTPQEKNILALRPKENSYGARTLSVMVEQTKRRLQKAEASLQIIFDTRN